ncbi:HAMP domain-containing sensor histidine kinase [Nocardiopsis changdeensis]|uniref:histidine kinase n=1 Tax=Nocardiopsis changdeensis TaxID=2831969 RepID=A0ABX8BTP5_9ACTN|nr:MULTISPECIES: HAMP domain-containing sensor histidine kinase [Nocardiopsis]QUX25233.1 HAMP domain-containing histidine kinase [Nocardiopsis changdeensis]QYX35620.1 HAMP domain-containing histidine kinase [Nocardiopsis sp. MT53]
MNLTARVVLRALLVMALVIGGVALLTYELVRVSGRADVDRLLQEEAALVGEALGNRLPEAAGIDGVVSGPEAQRAARQALATRPSGARHVTLVSAGGVRLQSTGGPGPVATLLSGPGAPPVEPGSLRTVDSGVGPLRVMDTAVVDGDGAQVAVVTVAAPLEPSRDAAGAVLASVGAAGAVGLAGGGLLLWAVVRRTLRPVREVSAAAKEVSPADLAARVPVPGTRDEIGELAGEINRMLDRIEGAEADRRRYLSVISHEVRTPLAVAEGHLELLGGPEAQIVRAELVRLRRVLEDLMAVARGGDEIDAAREPVFLPDLFDEVRSRAGALPAREAVTVAEPPPEVLLGDQARLEQCLANLIGNAVDHTPEGTRVEVSAHGTGDGVALVVADDGPGIAPDVLPRVFEPFVTTRAGGGGRIAGLGLAVVRSLVAAQGGRVDLDSGPSGTSVTITLPRATA